MQPDPRKILEEALRLPEEVRAALAASLLDSLETTIDPDAEAAWVAEIEGRIRELDSSAVPVVPWAEARRAILGR